MKLTSIIFILFMSLIFNNSVIEKNKYAQQNDLHAEHIAKAKKLYEKHCFSCHGKEGKGDGPAGIYLKPKPFDISESKTQQLNDSILLNKITVGKPPMPAFRSLPIESRKLLVLYVRELGKKQSTK